MGTGPVSETRRGEVLARITEAAAAIRGRWQFAALVVLLLSLGLLRGGVIAPAAMLALASLALPLLVFALIPWRLLISKTPLGVVSLLVLVSLAALLGLGASAWVGLRPAPKSPEPLKSQKATPAARRELWQQQVGRLVALVLQAQHPSGGFGHTLNRADSLRDPWTDSQCLAALASVSVLLPHGAALNESFDSLRSWRHTGLRARATIRRFQSTEVSAWNGIAFLAGLSDPTLWRREQERRAVRETIGDIYRELSTRQTPSGSWRSYPDPHAHPGEGGSYASAMALRFLLQLSLAREAGLDLDSLSERVERGVWWVLRSYDPQLEGWADEKGSGLQADLTTFYLGVLSEARRAGLGFVEADTRYRSARRAWLRRALQESGERGTSAVSYVRQPQGADEEMGATLVWYPWALLLATYLDADTTLPDDERQLASQITEQLWPRLPQGVDVLSAGLTFPAAETLLALGLIGTLEGWGAT